MWLAILLTSLLFITIQDIKNRLVYWFLFPIAGMAALVLQWQNIGQELSLLFLSVNLVLLLGILSILYIYVRIFKKKKFLNHSIGMGDLLFFIILAIGFPTPNFIYLFSLSILFSLGVFALFKSTIGVHIPLAGLQSVFLVITLVGNLISTKDFLYSF